MDRPCLSVCLSACLSVLTLCISGVCVQDQVSGTTTSMVLKSLESDTEYTVTVVPVYHEMEGKSQSKNGRTSEYRPVQPSSLWAFREPLEPHRTLCIGETFKGRFLIFLFVCACIKYSASTVSASETANIQYILCLKQLNIT